MEPYNTLLVTTKTASDDAKDVGRCAENKADYVCKSLISFIKLPDDANNNNKNILHRRVVFIWQITRRPLEKTFVANSNSGLVCHGLCAESEVSSRGGLGRSDEVSNKENVIHDSK